MKVAMAKERERRFQSGTALVMALEKALERRQEGQRRESFDEAVVERQNFAGVVQSGQSSHPTPTGAIAERKPITQREVNPKVAFFACAVVVLGVILAYWLSYEEPWKRAPSLSWKGNYRSSGVSEVTGSIPTTISKPSTVPSMPKSEKISFQLITTLKGHKNSVPSVAFSPNGKFLASGSGGVWEEGLSVEELLAERVVKVWEVGSWREVATLRGHDDSVLSVNFSPDGKFLASGSRDKTVKVWEVGSWQKVATLKGHGGDVYSVSFSPDGKFLASGSGEVKVWEVGSWREVATLRGHDDSVLSVNFSPDGKFLASGSFDTTVKVWEVGDWREVATLRGHERRVYSVSFSPDGKFLASGSEDCTVKVWEVGDWREVATLKGHGSYVFSVNFSPDGKFLASGSHDNTVKVWEVGSWREVITLRHGDSMERGSFVHSVTFSPDGKFLASGSEDRIVKVWRVR
jgi:WD40 repeat protein